VIRSARFGTFAGAHEPIVNRATFDRVQAVLTGKFVRRTKRHYFLFRRLLHCKTCGRSLIASARKGFVYYRCSTIDCPTTSVREDAVDAAVRDVLRTIEMNEKEAAFIEGELASREADNAAVMESRRAALTEAIAAATARLARLTDLLLDGKIDSSAHDERRTGIIAERQVLEQQIADLAGNADQIIERAKQIVGLAKCPLFLYESADVDQKRRLLEIVLSDCTVSGKTLEFSLHEPFATISKRSDEQDCRPHWNTPRTFDENRTFVDELLRLIATCPAKVVDALKHSVPAEEVQESAA
jgi:site-specific DNA recombinase